MIGIRYAIHPGWVTSRNDGQRHYVGADQLMRLYGVSRRACIVCHPDDPRPVPAWVMHLHPRYDGDYVCPGFEPEPAP